MHALPDATPDFEPLPGVAGAALTTLAGRLSTREAIARIAARIADARRLGIVRLLVDVRGLQDATPPTISERLGLAREWAQAADGRMVVAVVCPQHWIDPDRIGIVAAAGAGLHAHVTSNPDDARHWLAAQA